MIDSTFLAMDSIAVMFNADTIAVEHNTCSSLWNTQSLQCIVLGIVLIALFVLIGFIAWVCMNVKLKKAEYEHTKNENTKAREHEIAVKGNEYVNVRAKIEEAHKHELAKMEKEHNYANEKKNMENEHSHAKSEPSEDDEACMCEIAVKNKNQKLANKMTKLHVEFSPDNKEDNMDL